MFDRPLARTVEIVTEAVGDERVVYDTRTQTAHCLTREVALVWDHCDGHCSSEELSLALGLQAGPIARALEELDRCGLLAGGDPDVGGVSRRDVMTRLAQVGGAALAAPLIYSVAIAPAASAASACTVTGGSSTHCSTSFPGFKGTDSRCCSLTCYDAYPSGPATCVSSTCLARGTVCFSNASCCSGSCFALFCQ